MKKIENVSKKARELQLAVVKQMLTLATSGFGLVAALAWNSVIQEFVTAYVKKYLPAGSGTLSLLLYALIVTVLAVVVTLNLSKLMNRLEESVEKTPEKK